MSHGMKRCLITGIQELFKVPLLPQDPSSSDEDGTLFSVLWVKNDREHKGKGARFFGLPALLLLKEHEYSSTASCGDAI